MSSQEYTTAQRDETPQAVKARYRQDWKVHTYERMRYGNIKKSLPHYMDCDAINEALRMCQVSGNVMALDLACGTGRLTRTLAQPGRNIISADYSDVMLREAACNVREAHHPFRPVRADGLRLPFCDESFDAVFTVRFIRHYKYRDRAECYDEIFRVLKPGGVLIFDVINSNVDAEAYKRKVWDESFSREQICDELADHGLILFEILAGNIVRDPVFIWAKKWSLIRFGRWYGRLIRSWPKHVDAATSWIVYARKANRQKG